MKASIITVTFNSQDTIKSTIESVINQTYNNIEYIIIDGGSTDATIDIIKRYESKIAKWISEKDEGIYDALNKGLRFATGDLVGFLHSDDIYENKNIISQIVNVFNKTNNEIVYGDLIYVYKKDVNKIIRYWRAGEYNYERIKKAGYHLIQPFLLEKSYMTNMVTLIVILR
jgi:glycosyltransferase